MASCAPVRVRAACVLVLRPEKILGMGASDLDPARVPGVAVPDYETLMRPTLAIVTCPELTSPS
jgi:hypothetical protein